MLRTFYMLTLAVTLLPQVTLAQDSPLELFPANVDIVARLNEPDKTVDNVATIVDSVVPGLGTGDMIRGSANPQLGQAISNPTLAGVDSTKDWYLGVFSQGRDEPLVVFAIPAIDTDELVDAIGEGMDSSVHGNWVLYTDRGEVPEVASADASAAKSMNKEAAAVFDMGELGVYVNAKHLREAYEEELETGYDQVLEQLNNLRYAMPQSEGMNLGAVIEMYGTIVEHFYQAVRDANSLAVAVSVNADGLRIEEYLEFADGSDTANVISKLETSEFSDLSKLPKNSVAYYGFSGGVKELTKWGMELNLSMFNDADGKEQLETLFEQLDDIEIGAMSVSMDVGDSQEGLFKVAAIADVDPADEYKKYMRSSVEAMNEIEFPGFSQTSTINEDAETYGDLKADVVTIVQKFDDSSPQAAMQNQMQKVMFGPNGIQSRIVYLEDQYLTIMGGGPEAAMGFIKNYQSGRDNGVAELRSGLMKEGNMIVLVDVATGLAKALKAVTTIEDLPPIPINAQMIDNLFLTPSYIGVGVAQEGNSVRCRTQIPVAQMQNIGKIGMMLAPLAAGMGGQQF